MAQKDERGFWLNAKGEALAIMFNHAYDTYGSWSDFDVVYCKELD
jgi:hypothetical protein